MSEPDDQDTDTDAPEADTSPTPVPKKRRRVLRICAVVILVPLLLLAIAGTFMIGREIAAPDWFKARLEAQASEVLGGGSLSFGEIHLRVERDLHPHVRLTNVSLTDAAGAQLARVQSLEAQVSPRGLAQGLVLAQHIELTGAEIALRRTREGKVAVAFETSGNALAEAEKFTDLLDQFGDFFERPQLEALRSVRASGLIINYTDVRAGQTWTVDGGRVALTLDRDDLTLSASVALLSGRAYVTTMAFSYISPRGERSAQIGLNIDDAVAADIATQSPALSWLSVIEAPLSGALRATIDEAGTLGPVNAALEIGAGALRPSTGAIPIRFDHAKTYFTYDPTAQRLSFNQVEVSSEWGSLSADGQAYLRDIENGFPKALLGQFRLEDMRLNPRAVYSEHVALETATADFRLNLDPFEITFGEISLIDGPSTWSASGRIGADNSGWSVGMDLSIDQITRDRVLKLWPTGLRPGLRNWIDTNLTTGDLFDLQSALRIGPTRDPAYSVSFEFENTDARVMTYMPLLSGSAGRFDLLQNTLSLSLTKGHFTAPEGGRLDAAGSVFRIPNLGMPAPPAEISLSLESTITAALSILNQPPFEYLDKAELPVTLADGRASVSGSLTLPLRSGITNDDVSFDFTALLRGVRTEKLLEGRTLTAARLEVSATNERLRIDGPVRIGDVPATGSWTQRFDTDTPGQSEVRAQVELSQRFLDEFNIGLPRGSLTGAGQGDIIISLARDQAPTFELTSDLRGAALAISPVGWRKSANTAGTFLIRGSLGDIPKFDEITLEAAGLRATGSVIIAANGSFERARFTSVRLGDWLDSPVEIRGRGPGQTVEIIISGGSLDLRRADFGGGDGSTSSEGGPMTVALDRLQISEGISLDRFTGDFDTSNGGLSGTFRGSVNGGHEVTGTVVPQNGGSAVRIRSDNAGGVLRSAGFLQGTRKGEMELIMVPTGREGTFDGRLTITDIRLRDAPAMASLLDAISVVGLLQQMDGNGLMFTEVEADFRLTPSQIILTQSSAIGPSLGLSLDGIYTLANSNMELQGVVSPFYLLNGIGSIFTRPGEGLIGFAFNLGGTPSDPDVQVNPLSALTPGMFREIFRRPPPELAE